LFDIDSCEDGKFEFRSLVTDEKNSNQMVRNKGTDEPLDVEWVTTICNTDVESVAVQVVQKEEALVRARSKFLERSVRLGKKAPTQPLDINFLLIDSLSRAHFFRGLPLTANFLEDLVTGQVKKYLLNYKDTMTIPFADVNDNRDVHTNEKKPEFKIFQFFRYHVVGNNSGPNITPLSSGLSDDDVDDLYSADIGPEAEVIFITCNKSACLKLF